MPVKVRRFCTSVALVLFSFFAIINAQAQQATPQPAPQATSANITKAPTAAEIMRDRIAKAKALIAVRNYPAAAYELETIRRESNEPTVAAVVNVLLMSSYLEQGDYKRAGELLSTHFEGYKRNNANAEALYQAVAGQVVRGARGQIERYRSFGLMVSDRNLPLEAVKDIEAMRAILESVIEQSKETSAEPAKAAVATVLLEEATTTRAALARDDYDARRWRDAIADSREQMANTSSVVTNAVDLKPLPNTVAQQNTTQTGGSAVPSANAPAPIPVDTSAPKQAGSAERPVIVVGGDQAASQAKAPEPAAENKPADVSKNTGPLAVGPLVPYASKQASPSYPSQARQMRAAGAVRVDVIVDEKGEVEEITGVSGHTLLQGAARDAIMKWRFRPFSRDGVAVKATGFVTFNFAL